MLGTAKLVSEVFYEGVSIFHGNVYKLIPNWKPTEKHVNGYEYIGIQNTGVSKYVVPLNAEFRPIAWQAPFDDETALAVLGYKLEE